ncbi:hypothetical protein A2U01_0082467 [Trifolium medium]|uniref:Uncharacterized protein n=1 Tax=Trifolium medium TaxID=97028 RepID=A0A392TM49_9FABA|nr:hypothetical protein [Trifolium medium]
MGVQHICDNGDHVLVMLPLRVVIALSCSYLDLGSWRWVGQMKEEDGKREGEVGVEFVIRDGGEVAGDGGGWR